jgi:hypothetical protein
MARMAPARYSGRLGSVAYVALRPGTVVSSEVPMTSHRKMTLAISKTVVGGRAPSRWVGPMNCDLMRLETTLNGRHSHSRKTAVAPWILRKELPTPIRS